MNKRVVITGLGVISSIRAGKENFWNALTAGQSGITPISTFDTSEFSTHLAGEIKDFDPARYLSDATIRTMGRASQLAVTAAKLAISDAQLNLHQAVREDMGAVLGTTMGESQVVEQLNAAWIRNSRQGHNAAMLRMLPTDQISKNVARELLLLGPTSMIATACAAGNYAIGHAFDVIRMGQAKIVLAGGADAFSRIAFIGFNRMLSIAPDKVRPFDKNRKGMKIGRAHV